MCIRRLQFSLACLAGLLVLGLGAHLARAAAPVVQAVLFYSPTCGHCHKIMTEDLPPLVERYGQQLQILSLNVQEAAGQALYQAAVARFNIPDRRRGVPTLVVGSNVLVGSGEIPQQFPGLIEFYLAQGGSPWPDIPGLAEVAPAPAPVARPTGLLDRLGQDPVGNGLAIIVLAGLLGALAWTAWSVSRWRAPALDVPPSLLIPLLALAGLGVAGYLAYVESARVAAVCGPIGDCNTVQQSDYARLGGVPVGVLGLAGYLLILAAWGVSRFGRGRMARLGRLALLALTFGGTVFSVYLTFLEPFVIGASCAWCLTSAVLMAALLLASPSPGPAWQPSAA